MESAANTPKAVITVIGRIRAGGMEKGAVGFKRTNPHMPRAYILKRIKTPRRQDPPFAPFVKTIAHWMSLVAPKARLLIYHCIPAVQRTV